MRPAARISQCQTSARTKRRASPPPIRTLCCAHMNRACRRGECDFPHPSVRNGWIADKTRRAKLLPVAVGGLSVVKWRKWLAFTGWFLLGVTFGPPLFGAASTFFWQEAADGNTATRIVWRMYDRLYPPSVGLAFVGDDERLPDFFPGQSCNQRYSAGIDAADADTFELFDVIRRDSDRRLTGFLRLDPAYAALFSLPRPVLGALDACIGGSPLIRPFCQSYARRITDEAIAERAKSRDAIMNRIRRENEAIWCAATMASPTTEGQSKN